MNGRRTKFTAIACLSTLLCLGPRAWADPPEQAENLLPNASFEKGTGAAPADWTPYTWAGKATFEYAGGGRTGEHCVTIASEEGADAAWHVKLPVEIHSRYRLSGWIKTEDVKAVSGRGALLNLHNIQGIKTDAVSGTSDWTKVEVTFDTADQDFIDVNCLFGGWGTATGKAWYDDLRLERFSMEDWKPSVTIDVEKVGQPISKYIYGQFIEHLGRCIYGGIWAEMLEDRKFWYPITAEYKPYRGTRAISADGPFPVIGASPWQIIGPAESVTMVKEDSFVGEHTPRVAVGSGICQRDLGLVKGKKYIGYIWTKPDGDMTTVDVRLRWGDGPMNVSHHNTCGNATNRYQQCPFNFTAGADTTEGVLDIRVTSGAPCFIGTVSLMPADNVQGMRADTLDLLKQLDSPVYRWPGGNFVSGYDWKDGIGPRDRRPPRKNPAWTGVEHNDFGLDEFITFCRVLGTEPYIAVNSGLGGAESAVEELQYANGASDTPMGKLRAENGHAEPYGVKWWGIGNEMYGGWQLGHMPLERYIQKHNQFAEAMRAEDPAIKLVAVGATGEWSEGMMQHCADHMDLVSEHFYRRDSPALAAHVQQIPDAVRQKADTHRSYRQRFDSLGGKDIRIALDEWNYWYGPHVYGELGTRYFLQDALGVAAGLNEYARQSDIMFMANYAQTVNVIGCIKTSKTDAAFAATGLALKLYRQHFGELPVAVTADKPLDVMAALGKDRRTLTVAVVNPTMRKLDVPLEVGGTKLTGTGRRWQIAGNDPMAYNEPGKPPRVTIEETPAGGISDKLSIAPCSVTLYELRLQ